MNLCAGSYLTREDFALPAKSAFSPKFCENCHKSSAKRKCWYEQSQRKKENASFFNLNTILYKELCYFRCFSPFSKIAQTLRKP